MLRFGPSRKAVEVKVGPWTVTLSPKYATQDNIEWLKEQWQYAENYYEAQAAVEQMMRRHNEREA